MALDIRRIEERRNEVSRDIVKLGKDFQEAFARLRVMRNREQADDLKFPDRTSDSDIRPMPKKSLILAAIGRLLKVIKRINPYIALIDTLFYVKDQIEKDINYAHNVRLVQRLFDAGISELMEQQALLDKGAADFRAVFDREGCPVYWLMPGWNRALPRTVTIQRSSKELQTFERLLRSAQARAG